VGVGLRFGLEEVFVIVGIRMMEYKIVVESRIYI
jgi:hypothetical protein